MQGSSTRKTLVCASNVDSRESVRSLDSVLVYADFYNFEIKVYFTHIKCLLKKIRNTYEMYMKI